MAPHYIVNHILSGRIRVTIPSMPDDNGENYLKPLLETVEGVRNVRISAIIKSVIVEFEEDLIGKDDVLRCLGFLTRPPQKENYLNPEILDLRNSILRSGISGLILAVATLRKSVAIRPDAFDYIAAMATSYTVLSHGGEGNLSHPDVITGIVSVLAMGSKNIINVSWASWFVNLVEIINDWKRHSYLIKEY